MNSLHAAIVLALCSSVLTQFTVPPEFKTECRHDTYPPDSTRKLATYVINLDLPPTQRWDNVTKIYKPGMQDLLANIKSLVGELFGNKIINFVDKYFPLLAAKLPQPFLDEMQGIAVAANMPLGEITLYNIFYEFFTVCTSIIAQDNGGKLYHARNLDFGLMLGWDIKNDTWTTAEILRKMVFIADFQRNGKTVFKSTQYAGYVGVITGVKPQAFTLSADERFQLKGGYVGLLEWILGMRPGNLMGFLVRQVLENGTNYMDAQKTLAKTPVLAPVYFILGGNSSGEGSIITRGLDDFDILPLGKQPNASWFLVETNYDHWQQPPFFDDRRNPAIRCMNNMTQDNAGFKALFNVLSSKPMLNKLTTYTSLMQVNDGTMDAYVQDCPSPCSPW